MTVNAINTYIVPTAANEVTMPSQPAFLGRLSAADNNVTGNSTVYTLGTNTAFTEIYDQNADFTLNPATFTAPVTGKYELSMNLRVTGGVADGLLTCQIVTSNRTIEGHSIIIVALSGPGTQVSIVTDMDAADTATFTVIGTSQVADVLDLLSGSLITYVCGYLTT